MDRLDHRLARLRFRDLYALIAIAECGSLRRAAQRIGVGQPALTRALSEIEDAFGATLFIRKPSGIELTALGAQVLSGAEVLLTELKTIETTARTRKEPPLRIGCTPFLTKVVLPKLLAGTIDIEAQVREGPLPDLLGELSRGHLDALLAIYPDSDNASSAFIHRLLFKETLLIVAGARYPINHTWADLGRARWILPPPNSVIRRVVELRFLAEGLAPPLPFIESSFMSTNLQLVTENLGVAAISQQYLLLNSGQNVRIIGVSPLPEVPVSLVFRAGSESSKRSRILESVFSETAPL